MPGKRYLHVSAVGLLFLLVPALQSQSAPPGSDNEPALVLHVDSREAVLDVVARDRLNLPIADLTAGEFQVYEIPQHGSRIPRRILYLRTIDPHRKPQTDTSAGGFHVSSGAVCALDAAVHYQIAIQASADPGFHTILIQSTRPHVNLSFPRHYYVGLTRENATPKDLKKLVSLAALNEAACYHPLTPPTLAITARVIDAPGGKGTRYAVAIKPESLSDIGVTGIDPRVQIDFGICTFDDAGEVVDFLRSSVDHQLKTAEFERLQTHGLVSSLDIPGAEPPALARLVVLDRTTGNLGIVDVSRPLSIAAQTSQAKKKPKLIGDIRAFGSVTPAENTFCGDVYELPEGTSFLSSFREFDPVASLYTSALNVPNQNITHKGGIPGITHSSTWFGIDYYGKFYIAEPGEYSFELQSDDGARLEIDDAVLADLDGVHQVAQQTVITRLSAGWHSIHVPYFQGPPIALALVLSIQPPGEAMRPFNLNEFAAPGATQ